MPRASCAVASVVRRGGETVSRSINAHIQLKTATKAMVNNRSSESCGVNQVSNQTADEMVNHPKHYTSHPSGVECIEVVEHYGFNVGNCIKYLWRAGLKGDAIEDLKKARWYLNREIQKREKESGTTKQD